MNTDNLYIKDPSIREAIMKVKMYRVFSFVFFVMGFFIFLVLYNNYMRGRDVLEAFSIAMLVIILLPHMPAIALSWVALRADKRAEKMLESYLEDVKRRKAEQERLDEERARAAEAVRDTASAKANAEGVSLLYEESVASDAARSAAEDVQDIAPDKSLDNSP